jgi:hypothetical protein
VLGQAQPKNLPFPAAQRPGLLALGIGTVGQTIAVVIDTVGTAFPLFPASGDTFRNDAVAVVIVNCTITIIVEAIAAASFRRLADYTGSAVHTIAYAVFLSFTGAINAAIRARVRAIIIQ